MNLILKYIKNQRGVALLLSIGISGLLLAVVLQANKDAIYAVEATAVTKERHALTYNSMSGIIIAKAILIKDIKDTAKAHDAVCENWANSTYINQVLNALPSGEGKPTKLVITDELSRVQLNALLTPPNEINRAQEDLWDRIIRDYVEAAEYESEEINFTRHVIQCIEDWIDSNDDERLNGAEEDYYDSLDEPYKCKNNYFSDIYEMLKVKHIKKNLFYGLRIPDYVTVHGRDESNKKTTYKGLININTAPAPVLRVLIKEGYEDEIQDFIEFRRERNDNDDGCRHDLSKFNIYESEFGNLFEDKKILTTTSNIFRVVSTSQVGKTIKTITAILERKKDEKTKKWTCEIISWKDTS